ncbi:unnamed protein product [Protopolystoma xenopodis]|uniref:Uncharacterized protein n=1 Tax=Protopolystoma xenopodis TaxID=117903 RepID=A0A448XDS6_9PLAT|nr:unnamed protein product [Protopolystoma xenopodis]
MAATTGFETTPFTNYHYEKQKPPFPSQFQANEAVTYLTRMRESQTNKLTCIHTNRHTNIHAYIHTYTQTNMYMRDTGERWACRWYGTKLRYCFGADGFSTLPPLPSPGGCLRLVSFVAMAVTRMTVMQIDELFGQNDPVNVCNSVGGHKRCKADPFRGGQKDNEIRPRLPRQKASGMLLPRHELGVTTTRGRTTEASEARAKREFYGAARNRDANPPGPASRLAKGGLRRLSRLCGHGYEGGALAEEEFYSF